MTDRLFNLDHCIDEFLESNSLTITHPGIDPHFEAIDNVDTMLLIAKKLELADDTYRIIVTPGKTKLERVAEGGAAS